MRSTAELWGAVEALLGGVSRPARYIDREWGARHDTDADYRVALLYPDTYELGMANQALAILYERLNQQPGVAAERAFVPWIDMACAMREADVPLFTLESCLPVAAMDLFGITLPYELTYPTVLEALDLAGLPLLAVERSEEHPLVVGGGPCAFNPEPVAPFFDAILIGEGEDAVVDIVEAHRASKRRGDDRAATLRALAAVPGVYVPSLYAQGPEPNASLRPLPGSGAPDRVRKRVVADMGTHATPACPVVPFMDVVHDRVTVEVQRGCTRGCRFCQAGMVYRPVRERTADQIVHDAIATLRCTGYEEVSLTSLSTSDHSQIEEVLRRLARRLEGTAVSVSLPSLRADGFGLRLARLAGSAGRGGLTFAPEAGTQRLRDAINKGVTEEDLLATTDAAFRAGWRRLKLYFMIGLPTETDDDIQGIGALVSRVVETARLACEPSQRSAVKIAVSVSTLVPKAHTPFQWDGQPDLAEIERRQGVLRAAMPRKGVSLSWHDAEVSFVEATLARGGREVAAAIEVAWRCGAAFSAWSEVFDLETWRAAFEETGVDAVAIAGAHRPFDAPLPWSHLDVGLSEAFLQAERERTDNGEQTHDCSFESCTACGVCPTLGVDVVLGGDSRG